MIYKLNLYISSAIKSSKYQNTMTVEEINKPLESGELNQLVECLRKSNITFASTQERGLFNRFVFNTKKEYLNTSNREDIISSQLKSLENELIVESNLENYTDAN